jgi:hypothetical protein
MSRMRARIISVLPQPTKLTTASQPTVESDPKNHSWLLLLSMLLPLGSSSLSPCREFLFWRRSTGRKPRARSAVGKIELLEPGEFTPSIGRFSWTRLAVASLLSLFLEMLMIRSVG